MKRIATLALFLALAGWGAEAYAQPDRIGQDVVWVRDAGGATLTLDGLLDEAAWDNAETISLVWNGDHPAPGGGQKIEGNPALAEPLDPNDGTIYFLRQGNVLWLGAVVNDASIGGGRGLQAGNWNFDGLLLSIIDRSQRGEPPYTDPNYFANGATNSEWAYGWWHPADTTDTGQPVPGIEPRAFGDYGVGFDGSINDEPSMPGVWDWATTVTGSGVANDDTNGTGSPAEDEGYVMEMTIDLGALGYDFTSGIERVPFNVALQDADYGWPFDEDRFFVSRVWFQNQWMNNFNEGAAYLVGSPDVTTTSGAASSFAEPEFTVLNRDDVAAPTVDGSLDEEAWGEVAPQFRLQYQADPDDLDDWLPGPLAPYHVSWFRPDLNGDSPNPEVVDPTVGRFTLISHGDVLYIGLDTDDQAINGQSAEGGRDGFRITLRSLDSLSASDNLGKIQFEFSVDSSGAIRYGGYALELQDTNPGAVTAAVGLKGASTAADPFDVDEGYQIEAAIDLVEALGYPVGLGDRQLWLGLNFFDGDALDVPDNSTATRTWLLAERDQGASLYGYLEPAGGVANEDGAGVPGDLALLGNYPNPFAATTTLRYALPQSGTVSVAVYDVLGRRVALVEPGVQPAGPNAVTLDAEGLATGVYLYRVQLDGTQASAAGRLMVLK